MIPDRIAAAAARFPDRPAIERLQADGLQVTSYRELLQDAHGWSAWLLARDLQHGDRAAILGDSEAPWIAAYIGILQVGGVVVPLDTAYSASQVSTVLKSSGARWLFTSARYLATARDGAAKLEGACEIVPCGTAPPSTASHEPVAVSGDDSAVILMGKINAAGVNQ
jgi:acyl-CoA synthetase (AMP-forming)/AMP-acid ligase II